VEGHDVVGHIAGVLDVLVDGTRVPDPYHHVRCVWMFNLKGIIMSPVSL
jgi:hypothetical protein